MGGKQRGERDHCITHGFTHGVLLAYANLIGFTQ
jgi:hypothetical protein